MMSAMLCPRSASRVSQSLKSEALAVRKGIPNYIAGLNTSWISCPKLSWKSPLMTARSKRPLRPSARRLTPARSVMARFLFTPWSKWYVSGPAKPGPMPYKNNRTWGTASMKRLSIHKTLTGVVLGILLAPQSVLAQTAELNGANTAWILTSTALVLFMTLPGLALFYAGLVRTKNVLSVMMHCVGIACLASVLWLFGGYS